MKIDWLEKYAQDGLIRTEVRDAIYRDRDALVKAAGEDKTKLMADMAKTVMTASAGALSAKLWGIALYAPHVAMNAPLAMKIIKTKLENGLSDHDAQGLALLQSNHMPDVMRNKSFMPKLAQISPAKLGEIVADVYLTKEAAMPGSMGGKLKKYLGHVAMHTMIPLLIGAGGGAVNLALAARGQKKLEERLEESFNKAISLSNSEKEPLHDNKEKARQAFNSLAHFAPHVALEPQAARAFMSKIVAFDQGMHVDDIRSLSEIQKNISGSQKTGPFSKGFEIAGKFTNAPNLIQDAVGRSTESFVNDVQSGQLGFEG